MSMCLHGPLLEAPLIEASKEENACHRFSLQARLV